MLSHCISDICLFRSQSVLLFYVLVSIQTIVYYCPLLFSVQIIVINNFVQEIPQFLVVSNVILVLVVSDSRSIKGSNSCNCYGMFEYRL